MGKIIIEDNFLRYTKGLEYRLDQLQRGQTAEYSNTPYNMIAARGIGLETVPRNTTLLESKSSLWANAGAYVVFIKPSADFSFRYIEFYTTYCDLSAGAGYSQIGIKATYYGNESTFSPTYPHYPQALATKTDFTSGVLTDTGTTDVFRPVYADLGSTISLQGGLTHAVGIAFSIIGMTPATSKNAGAGFGYYISVLSSRSNTGFTSPTGSTISSDALKPPLLVAIDSGGFAPDTDIGGVPYVRLF